MKVTIIYPVVGPELGRVELRAEGQLMMIPRAGDLVQPWEGSPLLPVDHLRISWDQIVVMIVPAEMAPSPLLVKPGAQGAFICNVQKWGKWECPAFASQ
jgi:hypothetical protein